MATKPTVIFVPGAWHSPDGFQPTISLLESAGYTCVGVHLKSVGAPTPLENFDPDVEVIRAAITAAADQDQDVVLFMHSYGGVVGCAAVKDLDKVSRRQAGKRGGVSHLFFCCAFALPEGVSLMDALQNKPLPWFQISDNDRVVFPAGPKDVFYNDIPDDKADELVAALKPHGYKTFASKQTYAAWRDVPSTYLLCEKDNAIPLAVQQGMVEGSKPSKAAGEWRTESIDASHTPFVSVPEKVAMAVRRSAGENV